MKKNSKLTSEDLACDLKTLCVCCSTVILRVCNLVRLVYFLCYRSVARKRIVKTSGNQLRRSGWSDL
jgi:hypothetical protein